MHFISLWLDENGDLRAATSQDALTSEPTGPKMFWPGGRAVVFTEIRVGAVETTPNGPPPVDAIVERYQIHIGDNGATLRLRDGCEPVHGITWDFPRCAADVPAWLDDQGIATLTEKVRARVTAAQDRKEALRAAGIKDLHARGVRRMPERLRAWVTLTTPELAARHGIDAGVSLVAMLNAERARAPVDHPFKCRLGELRRRIAEDKAARKVAVHLARQRREKIQAARETQAGISAAQVVQTLTEEVDA